MTIKEKAKAYDEAIERAKKFHTPDSNNSNLKAVLELIFPKLADSEDERIRKGLIEALKTSKTVGELKFILPEPTREECIAYLEKQKEQKDGCFACDRYKTGYEEGRRNGYTAGYNFAIKEQKPAEWSEEDEKLLDFWLDVIDRNDWRMDENFCKASREFINRLKSLRPQP